MELDDLKSGWQNAGATVKNQRDLMKMTQVTNHPSLKKIRTKLLAETIFLVLFSVIYYDWFDGDKKPFYANVVLLTGLLLYIANDIIGYISIAKPIKGLNLKKSIANYFARVKRLAALSLVFSLLYSVSIIVFFTSVIKFTREKRFLLLALAIVLVQLILCSYRVWNRRIKSLKQQVEDFDANENQ